MPRNLEGTLSTNVFFASLRWFLVTLDCCNTSSLICSSIRFLVSMHSTCFSNLMIVFAMAFRTTFFCTTFNQSSYFSSFAVFRFEASNGFSALQSELLLRPDLKDGSFPASSRFLRTPYTFNLLVHISTTSCPSVIPTLDSTYSPATTVVLSQSTCMVLLCTTRSTLVIRCQTPQPLSRLQLRDTFCFA